MSHVRMPIADVVFRHTEEAAMLRNTRSFVVRAPHVALRHLARQDERLAAHLDGMAEAGDFATRAAGAALERAGVGEAFAATVHAIGNRDAAALERLLSLAEALPDAARGVISAFGWVDASSLRGITSRLLESPTPFRREVGLASCAMHRVDGSTAAADALGDADPGLRSRALCVIAQQGRTGLLARCTGAMADADPACAWHAARAAVLLGDRHGAVAALHDAASAHGDLRARSLDLVLKLCEPGETHVHLKALSQEPDAMRMLVRGVGTAGDPHYVPWLLQQMEVPALARLAGESLSLITGIDLSDAGLERKPPADAEPGPSEDPGDEDVSTDEDDGLPWPDPQRVSAWWSANADRWQSGARYFMGTPPAVERCIEVLRTGFQRQRGAAAEHLCLLRPGTWLFPTRAPAWRQQRWLDGAH